MIIKLVSENKQQKLQKLVIITSTPAMLKILYAFLTKYRRLTFWVDFRFAAKLFWILNYVWPSKKAVLTAGVHDDLAVTKAKRPKVQQQNKNRPSGLITLQSIHAWPPRNLASPRNLISAKFSFSRTGTQNQPKQEIFLGQKNYIWSRWLPKVMI
jgi:hypothetical protein